MVQNLRIHPIIDEKSIHIHNVILLNIFDDILFDCQTFSTKFPFLFALCHWYHIWWIFYVRYRKKCYLNNKIRSVWDVTARRSFQFLLSCSWKLLAKALGRALNVTRKKSKRFKMKFHDLIVNSLTIVRAVWRFSCSNSLRCSYKSILLPLQRSVVNFNFPRWNKFLHCRTNANQRAVRSDFVCWTLNHLSYK